MSFCLTAGLIQSCNDTCAGGVDKFWVAPADALDSLTIDVNGAVDSLVMVVGPPAGLFYEFEPYQETASFTETLTRENANTSVESVLSGSFICRSQDKRNVIEELASCACGLVVIHQEASGKRWIWGLTRDYLATLPIGFNAQLTSGEGVSGTALTDINQETITITARGTSKARELDSGVTIPV